MKIGPLHICVNHWRKPLHTKHHEYRRHNGNGAGRPRDGWPFDWSYCRSMQLVPGPQRPRWHILWLYSRDADGRPLARSIDWIWRPQDYKRI